MDGGGEVDGVDRGIVDAGSLMGAHVGVGCASGEVGGVLDGLFINNDQLDQLDQFSRDAQITDLLKLRIFIVLNPGPQR